MVPNQTRLILYWRARSTLDRDYKVFVHALDTSGKLIAQVDREPQAGNYPMSIWDAGEQVRDEYSLDVPLRISRIELGLYRAGTGERLASRRYRCVRMRQAIFSLRPRIWLRLSSSLSPTIHIRRSIFLFCISGSQSQAIPNLHLDFLVSLPAL